jgi:hypothetical protein
MPVRKREKDLLIIVGFMVDNNCAAKIKCAIALFAHTVKQRRMQSNIQVQQFSESRS